MEEFFIYLIKSAICLTLFLTIYILFFRRSTFIVFNRIYLIFGMAASLIIPFYTFSYDVIINLSPSIVDGGQETIPVILEQRINWWQIALLVYIGGIALLLLRNIAAYIRFLRLIRAGNRYRKDGVRFINNEHIKSPFTVLNYILINSNGLSETEEKLIIKHEITHVKQKHWIDLICSECMLILQWFNPFVWLYVSLQKENHEFLADKAVLKDGISPALYQAVLINRQFGGPVFSFSNSFNYSKPLTRLIMMKKTKSSPMRKTALLILIPVFGVFLWVTAKPNYVFKNDSISAMPKDTIQAAVYIVNDEIVTKEAFDNISKGTAKDTIHKDRKKILLTADTVKINRKKGEFLFTAKDSPAASEDNPLIVIDGKEYPDLNISMLDVKYIKSISVLKGEKATKKYGNKGKNGVLEITLEKGFDYSSLKNAARKKESVTISVSKNDDKGGVVIYQADNTASVATDTTNFTVNKSSIKIIGMGVHTKDSLKGKVDKVDLKVRGFATPLVIIDGKETSLDDLGSIDPDTIESISVLKDKTSIEKYGAKGKNGVMIIELKK